jgi:DNA replication initiation complex subunit (GINS family)
MSEKQDPYTELFDSAQKEKNNPNLLPLEKDFYNLMHEAALEKEKNNQARIAENMRRLIKEIYEKRERKIINMALDKSRTKTFLIDTTALLEEEKEMFESFAVVFDKFRNSKFKPVLSVYAKEETGVEIGEKQLIIA